MRLLRISMCFEPVGSPSAVGNEWNFEFANRFHFLYNQFFHSFFFFGYNTEIQFVVYLQNHFRT